MNSLLTHIRNSVYVSIFYGIVVLFGMAALLYTSAGIFLFTDSQNSIAVGIAGIGIAGIATLFYLRSTYFLQNLGTHDITVIALLGGALGFVYVITPLSYVNLFGATFQSTTLIALTAYACAFLGGYLIPRMKVDPRSLWLFIRTGVAVALLLQFIHFSLNPSVSLLGGSNAFSSAVIVGFMAMLSAGAILMHRNVSKLQMVDLGNIIIFVTTLIIVRSDMLLITTSIGVLIIAYQAYCNKKKKKEYYGRVIDRVRQYTITAGFCILLLVGVFHSVNVVPLNVTPVSQNPRPSIEASIYTVAHAFNAQPIRYGIGTGAHSFEFVWNNFMPDVAARSRFWNTDFEYGFNFMITFLVEFGIPAFLLGVLFFVMIITTPLHQKTQVTPLHVALFFGFYWLWLIVPGTFFIVLLMLCAGNILGHTVTQGTPLYTKDIYKKLFFVILLVFLSVGVTLTVYAYMQNNALYSYRSAMNQKGNVTLAERISLLEQSNAIFESPYVLRDLATSQMAKALELQTGKRGSKENIAKLPTIKNILENAEKNATRSAHISKNNYRDLITLADAKLLSALASQRKQEIRSALGRYKQAQKVARKRIFPKYAYMRALVAAQQNREAKIILSDFSKLYPQFMYLKELQESLKKSIEGKK